MLELLCWLLLPSKLKNRLLCRFGHVISADANVGVVIVMGVGRFELGRGSTINHFNVFRGLSSVRMEDHAEMGSLNWVSADPAFQSADPEAGTLFLGYCAKIGNRNYIDCSGTVVVREYGGIGGNRCLIQTHEPDYINCRQTVGRVTIGHHSSVGSNAVMLKGAYLPDQSLLAANSTMTGQSIPECKSGLYAGSPAVWKKDAPGKYFDRIGKMTERIVDARMGVLEEDRSSGNYLLPANALINQLWIRVPRTGPIPDHHQVREPVPEQ
jgi:acetyltransferase-like isoleucine patch superfamily enzyme